MPLIVEDGTGVAGANSYVSEAEAKAFASLRGLDFPAADADVAFALIQAMDYLEQFRDLFPGAPTAATQALAWPRADSGGACLLRANNVIPAALKNLQMQLAVDAYTIGELQPNSTGFAVAKEKIDVIEIEYATGGRLSAATLNPQPTLTKAQVWLDQLLYPCGLPNRLITVRV